MSIEHERADQAAYHRDLYGALWDHPGGVPAMTESGLQGLDQLGHFGSAGCDLVVDAIAQHAAGTRIRLAELGCGIGGALRYVVDALGERDVTVVLAVGLDAVEEHCRLMRRIDESAGTGCRVVCTSVDAPGIGPETLDVVFATGSASHFAHMATVLGAAARLLRPGGLLTFTEEVSLIGPAGPPSAAFRAAHPPSVFFAAIREERLAQLEAAGFTDVDVRDLGGWAASTLHRRMLALRVNREKLADVYGATEARKILDTIAVARDEIRQERLAPAHVVAVRRP